MAAAPTLDLALSLVAVRDSLAAALPDDEGLTDKDLAAIAEGRDEYARGDVVSDAEMRAALGLAPRG